MNFPIILWYRKTGEEREEEEVKGEMIKETQRRGGRKNEGRKRGKDWRKNE